MEPWKCASPKLKMPPSLATSQYPLPLCRRRDADDGLVEGHGAGGAVEVRVAEGEDAAVAGDHPVAVSRWCGCDADDGLVEGHGAGGAVEVRVAEAEDAAVAGDHPVAVSRRCGCDADDGLVEGHGAGGAVEVRVAEAEDAAVACDEPVTAVAYAVAAMPTIGCESGAAPVEPRNRASPKALTSRGAPAPVPAAPARATGVPIASVAPIAVASVSTPTKIRVRPDREPDCRGRETRDCVKGFVMRCRPPRRGGGTHRTVAAPSTLGSSPPRDPGPTGTCSHHGFRVRR